MKIWDSVYICQPSVGWFTLTLRLEVAPRFADTWFQPLKFLLKERREIEMDLRRKQEEAERLKEVKEAANKKEKMRIIKEQVKPDMFTTGLVWGQPFCKGGYEWCQETLVGRDEHFYDKMLQGRLIQTNLYCWGKFH